MTNRLEYQTFITINMIDTRPSYSEGKQRNVFSLKIVRLEAAAAASE